MDIEVTKDEHNEHKIPNVWRDTLRQIVEFFRLQEPITKGAIPFVDPVASDEWSRMSENISSYGDKLVSLCDETWRTSVCRWQLGYWEVIVDLCTEKEGLSDLVLFLSVRENERFFSFEISSINVP